MTTDQRFIAACKRAAELRPDLFECEKEYDVIYLLKEGIGIGINQAGEFLVGRKITQDNIDSMAAALGWEYEISRHIPDEPMERLHVGGWVYGFREIAEIRQHLGLVEYPNKLTAAKEAFIAIVEQIEKHSP